MTDEEFRKENERAYAYHFYFHDGLFYYIQHLKDFITTIDNHFSTELNINSESENESKIINPMFDPKEQFGSVFPDILCRATFLHSYFLLESSLDQICRNVQIAEGENIFLKDMAGSGIQRSSLYLKKVHRCIAPFETETWKTLLNLNRIRNIFVHADGNASITNKELYSIADAIPGLGCYESFDKEYLSLSVSKEFTTYALQKIEDFLYDLSGKLRSKNP